VFTFKHPGHANQQVHSPVKVSQQTSVSNARNEINAFATPRIVQAAMQKFGPVGGVVVGIAVSSGITFGFDKAARRLMESSSAQQRVHLTRIFNMLTIPHLLGAGGKRLGRIYNKLFVGTYTKKSMNDKALEVYGGLVHFEAYLKILADLSQVEKQAFLEELGLETTKAFNPSQKRDGKGMWAKIGSAIFGDKKSGISGDTNQPDIKESLAAIQKVHKFPKDAAINIRHTRGLVRGKLQAGYFMGQNRIEVSGQGKTPALSATHEMGHFLAHKGLGDVHANSKQFQAIQFALSNTASSKAWEQAARSHQIHGRFVPPKYAKYLNSPTSLSAKYYSITDNL